MRTGTERDITAIRLDTTAVITITGVLMATIVTGTLATIIMADITDTVTETIGEVSISRLSIRKNVLERQRGE